MRILDVQRRRLRLFTKFEWWEISLPSRSTDDNVSQRRVNGECEDGVPCGRQWGDARRQRRNGAAAPMRKDGGEQLEIFIRENDGNGLDVKPQQILCRGAGPV